MKIQKEYRLFKSIIVSKRRNRKKREKNERLLRVRSLFFVADGFR